jgi:hypothetical protein
MNRPRLKRLKRLMLAMEAHPEKLKAKGVRFAMSVWAQKFLTREGSICETAACAAGTAAMVPFFRQRGFRLSPQPYGDWTPEYKGVEGMEACELFFGIKSSEAVHIFSPSSYDMRFPIMPNDVARHIDEVLNGDLSSYPS